MSRKRCITATEERILQAAYQYEQAGSRKEVVAALKELHRAVIADIDESHGVIEEPEEERG